MDTELPIQHPFLSLLPYSKQNPDFVQAANFLLGPTLCSSGNGLSPRVNCDYNEPKLVVPSALVCDGMGM